MRCTDHRSQAEAMLLYSATDKADCSCTTISATCEKTVPAQTKTKMKIMARRPQMISSRSRNTRQQLVFDEAGLASIFTQAYVDLIAPSVRIAYPRQEMRISDLSILLSAAGVMAAPVQLGLVNPVLSTNLQCSGGAVGAPGTGSLVSAVRFTTSPRCSSSWSRST